jgi:hypothetical protein
MAMEMATEMRCNGRGGKCEEDYFVCGETQMAILGKKWCVRKRFGGTKILVTK